MKKRMNQDGAVSLLSVVIFATIITIVIAAYIRSAISQQNQSINYDLGTRAYYSAEAGVQDGIRDVRSKSSVQEGQKNSCKPLRNGTETDGLLGTAALKTDLDLRYTCQLIDAAAKDIPGTTQGNTGLWLLEPAQADPQGYNITVAWSRLAGQNEALNKRTNNSKLFPNTSQWSGTHPVLRVSFISTPKTATAISKDTVKQQVFFLNPAQAGDAGSPQILFPDVNGQNQAETVRNASCNGSEYACQQSFSFANSLFQDRNIYAVVQSVYGSTDYKISAAAQSTGRTTRFTGVVTIDVTAQAGNVFRRVRQTVPAAGSYRESWFDASGLVVGDGICKLFSIGEAPSQFSSQCNPLDMSSN